MKFKYWLATFAYCAFLYWLSSISHPVGADIRIPGLDKSVHMLLYGVLTAIVSLGIHRSPRKAPRWVQVFGPIAVAVAYGMFDEWHQLFVPLRSFDPYDLMADAAGAVLVQLFLCGYLWRGERR